MRVGPYVQVGSFLYRNLHHHTLHNKLLRKLLHALKEHILSVFEFAAKILQSIKYVLFNLYEMYSLFFKVKGDIIKHILPIHTSDLFFWQEIIHTFQTQAWRNPRGSTSVHFRALFFFPFSCFCKSLSRQAGRAETGPWWTLSRAPHYADRCLRRTPLLALIKARFILSKGTRSGLDVTCWADTSLRKISCALQATSKTWYPAGAVFV